MSILFRPPALRLSSHPAVALSDLLKPQRNNRKVTVQEVIFSQFFHFSFCNQSRLVDLNAHKSARAYVIRQKIGSIKSCAKTAFGSHQYQPIAL